MSDSRHELRHEFAELVASTRALLEWHEACGAEGFPLVQLAGEPVALNPETIASRADVGTRPERGAAASPSGSSSAPSAGSMASPEPAASIESRQERGTRLAMLEEQVRTCTQCELHKARTQTVFARGNPMAELCFVGEGPGADEDAQGEPFVGKAGQLLDKMIVAMGYQRDEVYICNIVKCRPPNNRKPETEEMAACIDYLRAQLGVVRPKVIVALGATAVQGLLGTSEGITRMRGKWKLFGKVPVMPTFHPAFLLRQPGAKREVWGDLQQVMKHLGKAVPTGGR